MFYPKRLKIAALGGCSLCWANRLAKCGSQAGRQAGTGREEGATGEAVGRQQEGSRKAAGEA